MRTLIYTILTLASLTFPALAQSVADLHMQANRAAADVVALETVLAEKTAKASEAHDKLEPEKSELLRRTRAFNLLRRSMEEFTEFDRDPTNDLIMEINGTEMPLIITMETILTELEARVTEQQAVVTPLQAAVNEADQAAENALMVVDIAKADHTTAVDALETALTASLQAEVAAERERADTIQAENFEVNSLLTTLCGRLREDLYEVDCQNFLPGGGGAIGGGQGGD